MNPLDPLSEAGNWRDDVDSTKKQEADSSYNSRMIMARIKDEWVRKNILLRKAEYLEQKPLNVFVGTWNVNGKKPSESLEPWLCIHETAPDIVVCGFQEIVELTAGNVVLSDNATKERCSIWVDALLTTFRKFYPNGSYKILSERHLVGVMLCVLIAEKHLPYLDRQSVRVAEVATGVMGMGNKGGCIVRFQLYDSTFCFVCAHLAAHRENLEARNNDYRNITQKGRFNDIAMNLAQKSAAEKLALPYDATMLVPRGYKAYASSTTTNSSDDDSRATSLHVEPALSNPSFGILEHDFIFWLGDFNYRISAEHSTDTVFHHVTSMRLEWLIANDQLVIEHAAGRVFEGFQEAPITFLPTYKFQVGTMNYDRRPDKKIRAPAYCDRILWKSSLDKDGIVNLKYQSANTLLISDHKPVCGIYEVRCTRTIPDKLNNVNFQIQRDLDRWENNELPRVTLSNTTLTFPQNLEYLEPQSITLDITNTGHVPVAWRFVPKVEDMTICNRWLRVQPDYGLLTPGETAQVNVRGLVNALTASRIAEQLETLDDVLVLRLENGRDHFIPISANMVPTCFGLSLSKLCRLHYPCSVGNDERDKILRSRIMKYGDAKAAQPLAIPKELWWLCNFLYTNNGLIIPYLFRDSANQAPRELTRLVRKAINYGSDLPLDVNTVQMCHAVAIVLLEFLDGLPEPVVPFSMFPRADIDASAMDIWGKKFLQQLPSLNHNCFVYIMTFLREVVDQGRYNHMDPTFIATFFSEPLMRPRQIANMAQTEADTKNSFDLAQWVGGSKLNQKLPSIGEKIITHFLQVDKGYFYK